MSSLAEAIVFALGEKAIAFIASVWPIKALKCYRVSTFHSSTSLSSPAEAKIFPQGEKSKVRGIDLWKLRVLSLVFYIFSNSQLSKLQLVVIASEKSQDISLLLLKLPVNKIYLFIINYLLKIVLVSVRNSVRKLRFFHKKSSLRKAFLDASVGIWRLIFLLISYKIPFFFLFSNKKFFIAKNIIFKIFPAFSIKSKILQFYEKIFCA